MFLVILKNTADFVNKETIRGTTICIPERFLIHILEKATLDFCQVMSQYLKQSHISFSLFVLIFVLIFFYKYS